MSKFVYLLNAIPNKTSLDKIFYREKCNKIIPTCVQKKQTGENRKANFAKELKEGVLDIKITKYIIKRAWGLCKKKLINRQNR